LSCGGEGISDNKREKDVHLTYITQGLGLAGILCNDVERERERERERKMRRRRICDLELEVSGVCRSST